MTSPNDREIEVRDVGCANQHCINATTRKAQAHLNEDHQLATDCCGVAALDEDGFIIDLKDLTYREEWPDTEG